VLGGQSLYSVRGDNPSSQPTTSISSFLLEEFPVIELSSLSIEASEGLEVRGEAKQ